MVFTDAQLSDKLVELAKAACIIKTLESCLSEPDLQPGIPSYSVEDIGTDKTVELWSEIF